MHRRPHTTRPGFCCAAILPLGLLATSALGQDAMPAAKVTLIVNGGNPVVVSSGATLSDTGNYNFLGQAVDPTGLWEASWTYSADLNPQGNAVVSGSAVMHNKGSITGDYEIIVEFPLCPVIQNASTVSGVVSITLNMDADGGEITTQSGDSVLRVLADGNLAAQQFYGPFQMGGSGAGTASTNNTFGMPSGSLTAPAMTDACGLRHRYQLTPGDKATVMTMLTIGADEANLVNCADLPGDPPSGGGIVGGGNVQGPMGGPAVASGPAGGPKGGSGGRIVINSTGSGGGTSARGGGGRVRLMPTGGSGNGGNSGGNSGGGQSGTDADGNTHEELIAKQKANGGSG